MKSYRIGGSRADTNQRKMANKDVQEVHPLTVNVSVGSSVSNSGMTTPRVVSSTAGQTLSMLLLSQAASRLVNSGNLSRLNPPENNSPVNQNPPNPPVNINVKIFNAPKVKDCPVYVLRGLTEQLVATPKQLCEEIQKQFGCEVVPKSSEFPIGYMKGATKVHIRTAEDISDVWHFIKKGNQMLLWCQGNLQVISDSDSDDEAKKPRTKKKKSSALVEKNNRIESVLRDLEEKHGSQYTKVQYRIWAEMVDIGTHR